MRFIPNQFARILSEARGIRARTLFAAAILGTGLSTFSKADEADYPRQPIRVVVPFSPGGASDSHTRLILRAIREAKLSPEPWVVLNVGGAGGTIGSFRARNARPDGYTIMNLHDGIMTAHHGGQATYGIAAFEPIAAIGSSGTIVCVSDQAEWDSLLELMADVVRKPGEYTFGANTGAPSDFVRLQLERAMPGAEFRFVQAGGGAGRFADLAGGHLDVTIFSVGEYLQFRDSNLRALGILSEDRHPDLPDLPTGMEQGVPVIASTTQFWWAPRGTDPERINWLADALETAAAHPDVVEAFAQQSIDPLFLRGEALSEYLAELDSAIAAVAVRESVKAPPLGMLILVLTLGLGILAAVTGKKVEVDANAPKIFSRPVIQVSLTLFAYVFMITVIPAGWTLLTAWMGVMVVALLTRRAKPRLIAAGIVLVAVILLGLTSARFLNVELP